MNLVILFSLLVVAVLANPYGNNQGGSVGHQWIPNQMQSGASAPGWNPNLNQGQWSPPGQSQWSPPGQGQWSPPGQVQSGYDDKPLYGGGYVHVYTPEEPETTTTKSQKTTTEKPETTTTKSLKTTTEKPETTTTKSLKTTTEEPETTTTKSQKTTTEKPETTTTKSLKTTTKTTKKPVTTTKSPKTTTKGLKTTTKGPKTTTKGPKTTTKGPKTTTKKPKTTTKKPKTTTTTKKPITCLKGQSFDPIGQQCLKDCPKGQTAVSGVCGCHDTADGLILYDPIHQQCITALACSGVGAGNVNGVCTCPPTSPFFDPGTSKCVACSGTTLVYDPVDRTCITNDACTGVGATSVSGICTCPVTSPFFDQAKPKCVKSCPATSHTVLIAGVKVCVPKVANRADDEDDDTEATPDSAEAIVGSTEEVEDSTQVDGESAEATAGSTEEE